MSKKSDAATIQKRVDHIYKLILNGENTRKIYRNPSIKKWNVTTRTIDTYIAKAREQLAEYAEYDKTAEYARAIHRLNKIYDLAITAGDLSNARGTIKDLLQLHGIAGPIHVKLDGNLTITSFAELVKHAQTHKSNPDK